jgi:hypothetical protein
MHQQVVPDEREMEVFNTAMLKDVARRPRRQVSKFIYFPAVFTQQLDPLDD